MFLLLGIFGVEIVRGFFGQFVLNFFGYFVGFWGN